MRAVCYCAIVVVLLTVWSSLGIAEGAGETFGCEANPTGDPIGGGAGYSDIKTTGDFIVTSKDELLDAFKKAKTGQVVFVPDGVEIDLTGHKNIGLPTAIVLAGTRGLNGSPGARIFTTWRENHYLMRMSGPETRITGLRFEGSCGSRDAVADMGFFLGIKGYKSEVDNCEIYNFNIVGIDAGYATNDIHIHHNYIHHCQRSGYGYGILSSGTNVQIIANHFDWCRHHVACGGLPGSSYEAAWNLVGPNANSTSFDMHGGGDRGDGTTIAGDWIRVHHNTIKWAGYAVGIRGVPSQLAEIHHNWFSKPAGEAVFSLGGNTRVYENVWGADKTHQGEPIEGVIRLK